MQGWKDILSTTFFISAEKAYLTSLEIELNKKEYKVGDNIIVTIHIVDKWGNSTKNLVYYYPYMFILVPNATTTMPTRRIWCSV